MNMPLTDEEKEKIDGLHFVKNNIDPMRGKSIAHQFWKNDVSFLLSIIDRLTRETKKLPKE